MKKKIFSAIGVVFFIALISSNGAWAGTMYVTKAATKITKETATLNGFAQSTIGLSGETFDYGTTNEYGKSAAPKNTATNGAVAVDITGLTCSTEYHFRFVGDPKPPRTTLQGSDMTFKTAYCKYENINAGPIWDNQDARNKCPSVCESKDMIWSGQWVTTVWGQESVCGCAK